MGKVLFVCVRNAGRSVMAEALLNHLGDGAVEGISAGTDPAEHPHPEVIEAMREVGIDVSGHSARVLTDDLVLAADRVITMGCAVDEGTCPAILYADVEDWKLEDPKGKPIEAVRGIRDEIRR